MWQHFFMSSLPSRAKKSTPAPCYSRQSLGHFDFFVDKTRGLFLFYLKHKRSLILLWSLWIGMTWYCLNLITFYGRKTELRVFFHHFCIRWLIIYVTSILRLSLFGWYYYGRGNYKELQRKYIFSRLSSFSHCLGTNDL